jgi:hypothetical protein
MVWNMRMVQGYQFPQFVPSWGEGWLWKPLLNDNSSTYSTSTPSQSYDESQYGLGDYIIGEKIPDMVKTVAIAGAIGMVAYAASKWSK